MIVLQVKWGTINLPNVKVLKENRYFQRSYTHIIPENVPKGVE